MCLRPEKANLQMGAPNSNLIHPSKKFVLPDNLKKYSDYICLLLLTLLIHMLKCLRASHITEFQNISSVSHFRIMYWVKFLELHKNLFHLIYSNNERKNM